MAKKSSQSLFTPDFLKGFLIGFVLTVLLVIGYMKITATTRIPNNEFSIPTHSTTPSQQCIAQNCHVGDATYNQCVIDCETEF